jgi:hypothetical protein
MQNVGRGPGFPTRSQIATAKQKAPSRTRLLLMARRFFKISIHTGRKSARRGEWYIHDPPTPRVHGRHPIQLPGRNIVPGGHWQGLPGDLSGEGQPLHRTFRYMAGRAGAIRQGTAPSWR